MMLGLLSALSPLTGTYFPPPKMHHAKRSKGAKSQGRRSADVADEVIKQLMHDLEEDCMPTGN